MPRFTCCIKDRKDCHPTPDDAKRNLAALLLTTLSLPFRYSPFAFTASSPPTFSDAWEKLHTASLSAFGRDAKCICCEILPSMRAQRILAVIQSDLQLIAELRRVLENDQFRSVAVSRSCQEAILYLRGVGIYANRARYPLPTMFILDCQNPGTEDLEVLSWVRERPEFSHLPLLLLCAERHRHLHVTCALDPACYIVDREDPAEILDVVRTVETTFATPEMIA